MKMHAVLAGSLAAFAALAGCAKDSPAGHIADNVDKANQEVELRAHKYVSKCDTTNLLWQIGGVASSNTVYDFQNGNAGKTIQFFSNNTCDSNGLVGQATYSGDQTVGGTAADGSRILDLNYHNVVVTISNQKLVDTLNLALIPSCGLKDWAVGAGRDVTAAAGGANCLIIPKPAQSFDIVETDGQTTFFGMKDASHDATTQDKRPVQLDRSNGYTKM